MVRPDSRSVVTREALLDAAERLFAERGIAAVSNRQVSEAAGQGNNAAVGYHFGTKGDLVVAVARRRGRPIEELRAEHVARAGNSDDLRVWLGCMVRPTTEHLEQLGAPTWYARFTAQAVADPAVRVLLAEELTDSAPLRLAVQHLRRCLPDLPAEVAHERREITRNIILDTCADRERALATGTPTPRRSWSDAATGLVDALVGLWTAPVTPTGDGD